MASVPNQQECKVMPRLRSINRLYELLDEYVEHVEASPLSDSSKKDYISFAEMFVRWADNDFTPGAAVK
jgi:hypothetical protein